MNTYYLFLKSYPTHVGFGFLLTFFSSLGQTFLISLYVPHILLELGISNSAFGAIYAVATIGSALLLVNFGGLIDHRPLPAYLYKTIGVLGAASVLLGLTHHVALLLPALLGLRFGGQGLMTHISHTVLGRHFEVDRGKALSLASLGFSVGEMVFPIFIALIIPLVGWRISLVMNATLLLAVLLPALQFLPLDEFGPATDSTPHEVIEPVSRFALLKDRAFWTVAPSVVVLSLGTTGVFFYQLVLAQSRGWSAAWYSAVFSSYAASRFLFGLLGGALVDRFTAKKLYAVHLAPLLFGLVVLGTTTEAWGAVVFLLSAGVSLGSSSSIKAALFAELHGTEGYGRVRSTYTSFMVAGTALGPMLFGTLLDAGVGFPTILVGTGVLLAAAALPTLSFSL
ncbi:MAG: MFS transporter [Spirochaetia bacterium]